MISQPIIQQVAFLSLLQLLAFTRSNVHKSDKIQSPASRQETEVLPNWSFCRPLSLVLQNIFNWDIPKPPACVFMKQERYLQPQYLLCTAVMGGSYGLRAQSVKQVFIFVCAADLDVRSWVCCKGVKGVEFLNPDLFYYGWWKFFLNSQSWFLKFSIFAEPNQDNDMHIKIFPHMIEHLGNSLPHSNQDAERFTSVAHWSSPASFPRTLSLYIGPGEREGFVLGKRECAGCQI